MSILSSFLDHAFWAIFLYCIWGVGFSGSLFHPVWSFALFLLYYSSTKLLSLPLSTSSIPYAMLVLLLLPICFILSPAQILLFRTKSIAPRKARLVIFNDENKDSDVDYCVDIVAVHGLASNPETTWTSRSFRNDIRANSSQPLWLRDFLPKEGLNARIMAFNHNTSWRAYALSKSLHDHGNDLLLALEIAREDEKARHRPIIFIGHSFGGLIIKQALVNASADPANEIFGSIRQKASGFIFIGTPHKGAPLTFVGKLMTLFGFWKGSSTVLLDVAEPASNVNANMHESFMNYLRNDDRIANTVCGWETIKMSVWGVPITNVVDKGSAMIDGTQSMAIEKDHRNMQRISDPNDDDYQDILKWIRRWATKAKKEVDSFRDAKAQEKTQQENECIRSLLFSGMYQRRHDVKGAAADTCAWLLNHGNYKDWLAKSHALLWIVGKPGAGKSTLVRYALEKASQGNGVIASFFFSDLGEHLQKNSFGLFRSLLHQLLDQIPEMLFEFTSIYQKKRDTQQKSGSDVEWHETELQDFLSKWLLSTSGRSPIQIYVDALDECIRDDALKLIAYLDELVEQSSCTAAGFKICFACRHSPPLAPKDALKINVENENGQDIVTFVQRSLRKHHFFGQKETQALEQDIISKASHVFQWVVLVIPIVLNLKKDGANIRKIRHEIGKIPGELSKLYNHILAKIPDQNKKRAFQLMQWICFAVRPLSLEELRFATVVDITNDFTSLESCQRSMDFAETEEQMNKTVISLSGGLAETAKTWKGRVVQLIHQSVNDYLIDCGLQSLGSFFFDDVNDYLSRSGLPILERSWSDKVVGLAHFRISRSCIKYMALEEVLVDVERVSGPKQNRRIRRAEIKKLKVHFPLLEYANNWTSHAKIVEEQGIHQADLFLLFQSPAKAALLSWTKCYTPYEAMETYPQGLFPLFVASQYGLLSVIEAMINSKDKAGQTPLSLAAAGGHEAVVQLLIEHGVDIDLKNDHGETPLSVAARKGNEAIIRLLIKQGAEIDSKDDDGKTPLLIAARKGNEAIVRLLIDHGVDINSKDNDGKTPLDLALEKGHQNVVEILRRHLLRRQKRLEGTAAKKEKKKETSKRII